MDERVWLRTVVLLLCGGLFYLALRETETLDPAQTDSRDLLLSMLPDQAAFDQPALATQLAEQISIEFRNTGSTEQQLVVAMPDTYEAVGAAIEAAAYPRTSVESTELLLAGTVVTSRLLAPGESETLRFAVPGPGRYPYLSGLPGEWQSMYGVLLVVDDLEDFLRKHPGLLIAPALKKRAFVQNWKLSDFESELAELIGPHSYTAGRTVFIEAQCGLCHSIHGEGALIGPDLSQSVKPRIAREILKATFDPSAEITEPYSNHTIFTDRGTMLQGIVTAEDAYSLTLITDPLVRCRTLVLPKGEIDERHRSKLSMMPDQLLDNFSREEIVELLAFLVAGGDPQHEVYKGR